MFRAKWDVVIYACPFSYYTLNDLSLQHNICTPMPEPYSTSLSKLDWLNLLQMGMTLSAKYGYVHACGSVYMRNIKT